jgi:glyoxylase I family protein
LEAGGTLQSAAADRTRNASARAKRRSHTPAWSALIAMTVFARLLQSRLMFTGIEHFAIASPNPRRLADFYVSTLEFEITFEYAGNYFVQAKDGALIEIIPSEGNQPESGMRTPGLRHIAISIENFDAAYDQLQKQGIKFEGEPYEVQGNRLAFFKDPDGNLLHLIYRSKPLK